MTILITGASRGIGAELVKLLCRQNDMLIFAVARDERKLNHLVDFCHSGACGSRVIPVVADLSTLSFESLMEVVGRHAKTLDIVVHNAGLLVNKPYDEVSVSDFDAVFDTNVKVPFFLTQALLPWLAAGSHVLTISSMGGFQGSVKFEGLSVYSAAKGALAVLTESLAAELHGRQISVNSLALGAVQTEMLQQAFPGYQAPVTAAQMSEFIAWFATHGHRVMNGKIVPVALSNP